MFVEYNPNPSEKRANDCVIRAICKAMDMDWKTVYMKLCMKGLELLDWPHANYVWGEYLLDNGYSRYIIPNTCPACYTVADFAADHPRGTYILGTGEHCVTVVDGDWYDTWDSGQAVPIVYYWRNE